MSNSIQINEKFKSSIRLDAVNSSYEDFVSYLILHGTLQNTLETICNELEGSAQRAFTVTGPYGSGKSTLAALLSGAVGKNRKHRELANQKLGSKSKTLEKKVQRAFNTSSGWAITQHVCGLANPAQSITESILRSLNIVITTTDLAKMSDAECINEIKNAFIQSQNGLDGCLILLDEMGKALDFQSNHDSDLYFFQELADAVQSSPLPVIIIGFLHQAFSQYAKGKTALTQQEWAKVQGRYRDLNYNPTIDESLILIGESVSKTSEISQRLSEKFGQKVIETLATINYTHTETDSFIRALPLDPLVSLVLGPISRRRFSQNERSIFSFLASNERFGFNWFLEHKWNEKSLNLYDTSMLWNYLDTNLSHLISTSPDGKAWLEAQDAIFRASQKGNRLHSVVITTIALVTVFGQKHHIYASRGLLKAYLSLGYSSEEVDNAINDLERWSLIIFRKRHDAFFIFQGSDLDINSLIIEEVEAIKEGVKWAGECRNLTNILASSHYHLKGTMRWASKHFVETVQELDAINASFTSNSGTAFCGFVQVAHKLSPSTLADLSNLYPNLIISSSPNIHKLKESAVESIAIKNIFKREEKLAHDHIAKQELENRGEEAELVISEELELLFNNASWFYKGKELGKHSLSKICSHAADSSFPEAPCIINELVNRSKPSGSANSATNKLMLSMLHDDRREDLGFDPDTFPPEKGIYLSVLKGKGWHQETPTGYQFISDWSEENIERYFDTYTLWKSGFDLIRSNESILTISELYAHWMNPPYGLPGGLCRIYALALLKSLEGQVAYYDKDSTTSFIFIPELDDVIVEKLHKHAHEVGVRYFKIDSVQTHLVKSIAEATQSRSTNKGSLLQLAKEVVRIVHQLPSWVKKTSGISLFGNDGEIQLSQQAKDLRNITLKANDPYKLILEEIPSTFDIDTTDNDASVNIIKLSKALKSALDELKGQQGWLLDAFTSIIRSELSAELSSKQIAERSIIVAESAHRPAVKEFARRLHKYSLDSNETNLIWLVSTAMGVAERNWTDKHINNGLHEIHNLCRQFRREESFNKMTTTSNGKTFGLISSADDGGIVELEGHVINLDTDVDTEQMVTNVENSLSHVSDDTKREVLIKTLSKYMYPVKTLEESSDD